MFGGPLGAIIGGAYAASGDDEALKAWLGAYSEHLLEQVGDEIDEIEEKVRDAVPATARGTRRTTSGSISPSRIAKRASSTRS